MKNTILKTALIFLSFSLIALSCKKDTNSSTPSSNTGTYNYNGTQYSGQCESSAAIGTGCGGIDVIINSSANSGNNFIIYNMPTASSGTFNILDGFNNVQSCNLYALIAINTSTVYASKSMTLTKTGAKTFSFTGTVYDISTNNSYNVSGSGTYN